MCKLKIIIYCVWICCLFSNCSSQVIPPDIIGILRNTNNKELEKAIEYYDKPEDSLKLEALYFLIRNMDGMYSYEGKSVIDARKTVFALDSILMNPSLSKREAWDLVLKNQESTGTDYRIVRDIDIIESRYLIQNIDNAFAAWRYPWARSLNFDQFCKYILPYKLKNESLDDDWRTAMMSRYKWVLDSVKNKENFREAAIMINEDLRKWFEIVPGFNYPFGLSLTDLTTSKLGTCAEASQLAAYAMRAMGIPVTMDFTPYWANKGKGHDWNCLLNNKQNILFMGTESNPGLEKIESSGYNWMGSGAMPRKRAKIYRYSFTKQRAIKDTLTGIPEYLTNQHIEDVSKSFIPVSDITLKVDIPIATTNSYIFLCIFNNKEWKPIAWTRVKNKQARFADMGKDIVYLPQIYYNEMLVPAGDPFLLPRKGVRKILKSTIDIIPSVAIYRKYPEDAGNKVLKGDDYELFYWKNDWISLGKQTAIADSLIYKNVPNNALFFLRNLKSGFQERIFTIENLKQVWW